jgi:DNA polymerase III alpha subunit
MVSLHTHSYYSLLEGTIPVEELVAFAKKSGSRYASLTDTNAMYGLIQFAAAAAEQNIKPLLGVWIDDPEDKKLNAVFIAKNNEGYSNNYIKKTKGRFFPSRNIQPAA